jgi:hypothetical protein
MPVEDDAGELRVFTDELVTLQLSRSSLSALIESDQYSRQRDYRSIYDRGRVSLEEEHYHRQHSASVAKAYAHYQLLLRMAAGGEDLG